jgi:SAM-dependent methyltransferase
MLLERYVHSFLRSLPLGSNQSESGIEREEVIMQQETPGVQERQEIIYQQGLVSILNYRKLSSSPLYVALDQYSQSFLSSHKVTLTPYSSKWVPNPFHQWSRRYEYPFIMHELEKLRRDGQILKVLDAGSGATFFPFYVQEDLYPVQVTCLDSDRRLKPIFNQLNEGQRAKVNFELGDIGRMPLQAASFDAVYCISVLEHTTCFETSVSECARVLKPGGRLLLTFDVATDMIAEIPVHRVMDLLGCLARYFNHTSDIDWECELVRVGSDDVLSTRMFLEEDRTLLPWRYPAFVALGKALQKGRLPTSLFRNLNCCCMVLERSYTCSR